MKAAANKTTRKVIAQKVNKKIAEKKEDVKKLVTTKTSKSGKQEAFWSDRNFALEAVRVTEAAALACARLMGRGDEKQADQAAVNAMREALNGLYIDGTVVIGEGERDKAPMLYIGEKVGKAAGHGPQIDIALDPLEGTTICAKGGVNALAVIAMAEKGGFLHAPDVYMNKIAVGAGLPEGVVDLDDSPAKNLKSLAKAKKCDISDLVVVILERDRHEDMIAAVREAGARIQLIADGDVAGVIAASRMDTGVDMYMGIGGAPEGVLAAAALRSIGGQMQGRLIFANNEQKERAKRMGITNFSRKYQLEDLAKGDVMFAATGVTDGNMLRGVRRFPGGATTHSIVMRSKTGTVRLVHAEHNFTRKTWGDLF
ncbi:MAG: class II fructose-bisphosphatase [Rickettsiales bacterium]|nr:class II fructose-bisphosphatase [Rickettsiales bacterium]